MGLVFYIYTVLLFLGGGGILFQWDGGWVLTTLPSVSAPEPSL